MSSSIPNIINLEELLTKSLKKQIKIINKDSKLLTAPGENYGSIMVALDVTIEDEHNTQENLNLVAKLIPTNELLREIFQVQITFKREYSVYTKIVPALRQLEEDFGVVNNKASDLFGKCFGGRYNINEENDIIDNDAVLLLQNLKIDGYENGDRLKGFNYDTAAYILKKLAIFHGTPIALKIKRKNIFIDTIYSALITKLKPNKMEAVVIDKFISNLMKILLEEGNHYESFANKTAETLRKSLSNSIYNSDDWQKPFVTFSHNDFWVNNMMIKIDSNEKPLGLKIVDFQTPECQSLAADLLFFIYTSISPDVLYGNEEKLLKIYYDSFIECLKQFSVDNLEDYTWDAFKQEIKERALFALSHILFMYKIILLERGNISDMNDVKEDDIFDFKNVSESCKLRMRKTFESFVKNDWIS